MFMTTLVGGFCKASTPSTCLALAHKPESILVYPGPSPSLLLDTIYPTIHVCVIDCYPRGIVLSAPRPILSGAITKQEESVICRGVTLIRAAAEGNRFNNLINRSTSVPPDYVQRPEVICRSAATTAFTN